MSSSVYCSSAVAVSAAATATLNPLLFSHSISRLVYRFAPKSFKLVADCSIPLSLHSNIRRHRFSCAADTEYEISALSSEEDAEDEKQTTQASGGEEGRLYVGNLPYTITASELSQLFRQAGTLVDVQIVYDKVTDRSRGFGFVTMGTIQEAKEAINIFNTSQIGGRTVKVNFPEVPRGGEREVTRAKFRDSNRSYVDSPHKLYAGNLGWNLTSQGLKDAFADQPGVIGAKVVYERDSGRSRGFGFVSFESPHDLQYALSAMNGVEVEGRELRLNMASERADVTEGETEESRQVLSTIST